MLQGKTAIITGASKGIGLATARMLAQEGVNLVLNARTPSDLEQVQTELASQVRVEIVTGSVADPEVAEQVVQKAVQAFGKLDILINNAGVAPHFALLQELTLKELNNTIDINLKGPIWMMKYAIPQMVHQGGGFIINLNSTAGKIAYPYSSVYCASKWGLHALSECVSQEQRSNNIKVIEIFPGEVYTPIWDTIEPHITQNPDIMLDVEDVAQAIRYALTQQSKAYIKEILLVPTNPPVHE